MKKNITCKTQNFYIPLVFLLITITLLIAVSISDKTSSKSKTFITISWHKIKIILYWQYKLKSKNESTEVDLKNRVVYYFDDIINGTKVNFSNILLNKERYENI